MRRSMVCASLAIASLVVSMFWLTSSTGAGSDKTLVLYCTDVASSTWLRTTVGNHVLIAPEPASGNTLLNGVRTEVIDLTMKRAFIDQADPNNPIDDKTFGAFNATVTDVAIHINNTVPSDPKGATYVNINIDRRTGLYFQTNELFDETKKVASTFQFIRVCGTNKQKF
jgi:hypothetical protein